MIDERDLAALDFVRVRERLAGQTHTARGFARAMELVPADDFSLARRLGGETAEMRALLGDGFGLARVADVAAAVETAARGLPISPTDLRSVADALAAAAAAARAIRAAAHAPLLHERVAALRPLPALASRITDAVDERGSVLDRASTALGRIRRAITVAQDDARERAAALVRSPKYARAVQDQIVTVRDGRFVVPIKSEFAGEVPGIVHDASSSGATLFVEPLEALETNNRLRALRVQEEHEVARIVAELSALVGADASALVTDLGIYEELDLAAARAALAERMDATAPVLTDAALFDVRDARHPLLDVRAVPQSFRLDDDARLLLISGPNMGGKTVTLKMAGLFVAMAGCGLQVPAAEATIGRFTRVYTDIGDEQSIALNASTFSAHLARLAEVIAGAGARTLILMDEIGAGTEPNAGAALAVAALERFIAAGSRVIATTHATELKLFGAENAHVRNASVRFDPETHAPTYQLDVGSPGQSLAFPLARAMRVDPAVVARAEELLSHAERAYDRALAELAGERAKTAREGERLAGERARLHTLEEGARKRADALERERREIAARAEARLTDALHAFTAELQRRAPDASRGRGRVTRGQSELLARTIEAMRKDLGLERTPAPDDGAPLAIGVGDRVYVASLEQEGVVAEVLGADALVTIGPMRTLVSQAQLQRRGVAPRDSAPRGGAAAPNLEAASRAQTELDVRGKRYVEAEPDVERWIDEAVMLGHSPLRLIHGKGTGLLGRGLQQYLRAHPNVSGVRYGNADEGGSGVTVFELR
ncbi:MAG: endonuclease MutS2 [Candidatus Velthaea sp.]